MIKAEVWEVRGQWHALIGCEFYKWHQGRMVWIRAFWHCGDSYERAKYHGKIHNVKVRLKWIKR